MCASICWCKSKLSVQHLVVRKLSTQRVTQITCKEPGGRRHELLLDRHNVQVQIITATQRSFPFRGKPALWMLRPPRSWMSCGSSASSSSWLDLFSYLKCVSSLRKVQLEKAMHSPVNIRGIGGTKFWTNYWKICPLSLSLLFFLPDLFAS